MTTGAEIAVPQLPFAVLDGLIEALGTTPEAAARARTEYELRTGRIFEDDELFERRMAAFLEWCVVEAQAGEGERGSRALVAAEAETDPGRRAALRAWAASHRSVFVVEELAPGVARVRDLIVGLVFQVAERRSLPGVTAGDVLEARVYAWDGAPRFGRTFLYHPSEARAAIEAHAARILARGGSRIEVVDHVATLRSRIARGAHGHTAVEKIYEAGARERAG